MILGVSSLGSLDAQLGAGALSYVPPVPRIRPILSVTVEILRALTGDVDLLRAVTEDVEITRRVSNDEETIS